MSKKEQLAYDIGWAVGFWVGEGWLTIQKRKCKTKSDSFSLQMGVTQNEILCLKRFGEILDSIGINDYKIHTSHANRKNIQYALYLNQKGAKQFLKILKQFPLYSEKREEKVLEALKYFSESEKTSFWGDIE